jgi:hypothetical protein
MGAAGGSVLRRGCRRSMQNFSMRLIHHILGGRSLLEQSKEERDGEEEGGGGESRGQTEGDLEERRRRRRSLIKDRKSASTKRASGSRLAVAWDRHGSLVPRWT